MTEPSQKKVHEPIEIGSKWLHKKMDMVAVVERVTSHQVSFIFDGCLCLHTKSDFRRKFVKEIQ